MAENAAVETSEKAPGTQAQAGGKDNPQTETKLWTPESDDPKARKSGRAKWIVLVVIVILAVVGWLLWRHYSKWESTDDAQIDGHINPVSARISGHVVKVNFENNQYVQAGDVLVEIDPTDYNVAVQSAQADLESDLATARASQVNVPITSVNTSSNLQTAGASVQGAEAGVAATESQSTGAQAQLREAEADNKKAQDDLARYAQLVAKQEISQQQYDQANSVAKSAAAAVDAARANVASFQQQVSEAQSKVAQAQAAEQYARTGPRQVAASRARYLAAGAAAEKSRAALKQAQLNLQYTVIKAPVSGIVSQRSVEAGENVQPGQQLLSVVPLDDIWVTANFKETQLQHIKPGQSVKIHVDAAGRDYQGSVEDIGGGTGSVFSLLPPENATGNYVKIVQRLPVRIRINPGQDSDHRLRLGMSAEPRVRVG